MSDTTTPNAAPAPDHNPPSPDPIEMNGGGYKKLWMLIAGFGGLAILIIALLLPTLGHKHINNRAMKNTTQVRGIVQGLVTYAGTNKERMPGTNSKGFMIPDVDGPNEDFIPASKHGGTVEGRFWLMLDNNNFNGDYIISPSETKTAWTTGEVSASNYSYALLNIHSNGGPLPNNKTRPNQTGRAREWRQSIDAPAVLIADRARIPGSRIGSDYDKIYSIHTSEDDGHWAGSIGRGDGSAYFENDDDIDTQYGSGANIEADRLFSLDQDNSPKTDNDILTDPDATWDDTANALLGYTSVGYQDPDIASE